jgi:hypothetical protein
LILRTVSGSRRSAKSSSRRRSSAPACGNAYASRGQSSARSDTAHAAPGQTAPGQTPPDPATR